MAILLSDARASLLRLKHDLSDVDNTLFVEWADWINKFAYRYLQGIDPDRYIQETTFTISSAPSTQALPADFDNMQPLGCGIYEVNDDGTDTPYELTQTYQGRTDQGFYLEGANVVFTGYDSKTVKMRYMQTITALTAITDYFTLDGTVSGVEIIPDEYLQYVVYALDTLYTQWDEEPGAEGFADARFTRALDELARNIKRTGGVYSIPSFNHYY